MRGVTYSNDGKYIYVPEYGVYSTTSNIPLFRTDGDAYHGRFSDDSRFLVVTLDGVYDTSIGNRIIDLDSYVGQNAFGVDPSFDRNSRYVVVTTGGVFDLEKISILFPVEGSIYSNSVFSPNGEYIAVPGDALYSINGTKLFDLDGIAASNAGFNAQSQFISISGIGTYSIPLRQLFTLLPVIYFSPDNIFAQSWTNGACLISGSDADSWPFRTGVIDANGANIRAIPNLNGQLLGSVANYPGSGYLSVFAKTPDSLWYKVYFMDNWGWVSSSVVNVISIPLDVPIENP